MRVLVTGGHGFIGSNFIFKALNDGFDVLNIDKDSNDKFLKKNNIDLYKSSYNFEKVDISDKKKIHEVVTSFKPNFLVHFAAESHVDNSILNPELFLNTNIIGTYNLLNASKELIKNRDFLFIHISTDEVYGDLSSNDPPFEETNQYLPNSPYSASKAASDHLVRSFYKTYGLKSVITNCSNNYGKNQHPEKLIPHAILRLSNDLKIPVYGNGLQIRDWLYVDDHCSAILKILKKFNRNHDTFNVGSRNEIRNVDLLKKIVNIFFNDKLDINNFIENVSDRKGHDVRYSINPAKLEQDLDWKPSSTFDTSLAETINWYKENNWILTDKSDLLSKILTKSFR